MKNTAERQLWPDAIRVIALSAMVLLHVAGADWYGLDRTQTQWQIVNFYDCLARWCVPVFFMISGYLFLGPASHKTWKEILTKNSLRLLTALIGWGGLYFLLIDHPPAQWRPYELKEAVLLFLKDLFTGNLHYHLWFLYSLIGLYFILPLFKVFVRFASKEEQLYVLSVGIVFSCLYSFVVWSTDLLPAIKVPEMAEYSFYLLAGHYLGYLEIKPLHIRLSWLGLIAGILFTVISTSLLSQKPDYAETYFMGYKSPNVVISAFSLFLLARYYHTFWERTWIKRTILWLSPFSFGVYLLHDSLLLVIFRMGFRVSEVGYSAIYIPALTVMVILASALLIRVGAWIPFFRKYMM